MFYRLRNTGLIVSLYLISQTGIVSARPQTVSLGSATQVQVSSAGLPDATADRVLGQATFNTGTPGTSATGMHRPAGVAIAPPGAPNAGRLFVVEYENNRVLSWPSAASFADGQAADLVIGQENFTTGGGALAKNRFDGPEAAIADVSGRLWVADTENNRVLRFDPPFSDGMDASVVLGQLDYDSADPNQGGSDPAANTLYFPRGLAMDASGNLYVADDANHRVLRFSAPFDDGMPASLVIGQEDDTHGDPNRSGAAGPNTLNSPKGIAMDAAGNLYVAEYENNRVTLFMPPFGDDMNAIAVYGQLDFFNTSANQGGVTGQNTLSHPVDVAVSAAGNALFVTDQWNTRVLGYYNPLSDVVPDQVYGQPDFLSATWNNGGISRTSINKEPLGVAVDANGALYLADDYNHRLLAYDPEVVGNGAPGSCTEAALDAALAGGGIISFNCGTAQINLTGAKPIAGHTTIDGGSNITLSGLLATQLFYVPSWTTLTLRNIVLADGKSNGDGGAIDNNGALVLENSTIRDSMAAGSGGAIVNYGTLTIRDSLLERNQALNGGAIFPRWGSSTTIIINSILRDNHATDESDGWGGAILAWDGAVVIIQGSDIYGNTAQSGGGIYNFANSVLYLGNTQLRNNVAGSWGGGVYNAGILDTIVVTLSGNAAKYGGGLYNYNTGAATPRYTTLTGNSATNGGGLYNDGASTLTNVTFSGNSATFGGGLYNNEGTATLINATLSDNSATYGGGIYNWDILPVVLKGSIIANSPSGGNCSGAALTSDNSDQYSLSSDSTCLLAGIGSQNGVDPMLMALGDYGGVMPVHMLQPGSPAIDYVAAGCPPPDLDQRGNLRPADGDGNGSSLCDAGAVEVTESDLVKKVYLPIAIK